MHWRQHRFETPLAVRDTGVSVTRIWSVLATLVVLMLLVVVVWA
jgi:hypothetical protein